MIKINAKELVETILERANYRKTLSTQEIIEEYKNAIRFEIKMYNKHYKHKNNRFDLKHTRFNIATIISNIETIKKGEMLK